MNCKPGDLAYVIRSYQGNTGKIVRCIEFVESFEWFKGEMGAWKIEPPLHNVDPRGRSFCADEQLRPLRDPGEEEVDETLLRLPSPKREKVTP